MQHDPFGTGWQAGKLSLIGNDRCYICLSGYGSEQIRGEAADAIVKLGPDVPGVKEEPAHLLAFKKLSSFGNHYFGCFVVRQVPNLWNDHELLLWKQLRNFDLLLRARDVVFVAGK